MSQSTLANTPGDEAEFQDEAAARSRKAVLLAGGVAAALLVGGAGWFLLGSNGDSTVTAATVTHMPAPVGKAKPKTTVTPEKQLPAPYKAQLGRDPFKALYVAPPAAAAGTATTPVSGTGTTPVSGTGTTPTSTTPVSGTGTTSPASTRYTLKLLSISKPSPEVRFTTWSVAGSKTTVIPAQRFGKYGELVVLAYSRNASGVVDKAIIQVGDDSPIDVTVGESISVL